MTLMLITTGQPPDSVLVFNSDGVAIAAKIVVTEIRREDFLSLPFESFASRYLEPSVRALQYAARESEKKEEGE
jgi:hypothetical protein